MKQMKIFPKTFFYTLGLMLFIVGIAHLLLYLFTKPEWLIISVSPNDELSLNTSLNVADYVTQAVLKALPLFLLCCVVISIACSFVFSRRITVPIKQIGAVTEQMARMEKDAACKISSKDEIGLLADNINHLYKSLLSAIESLEIEKQRVSEIEKSKVDFLRAASHELKTPVTALNATLENMILGVGKYKDYDSYLQECREMTGCLADMIHDILETSKVGMVAENEEAVEADLSEMLSSLCEPYTLQDLFGDKPVGFDSVAFTVYDPAQLDSIISEVNSLSSVDWRAFTVTTNDQTYLDAAAPLQKLQALMSSVIWVITLVSAVILSLILTMWGRSRIYETGVLLSLGIGKMKIIGQYLAEVLMVAVIALGCSYFTSSASAGQLANGLLQQNIPASEKQAAGVNSQAGTSQRTVRQD